MTFENWRDSPTRDHIIPYSHGSSRRSLKNLVAACGWCNNGRATIDAFKYYRFVQWKGRIGAWEYSRVLRAKMSQRLRIAPDAFQKRNVSITLRSDSPLQDRL